MKFELTDDEAKFLMRAIVDNYAEGPFDFDPNNPADLGMSEKLMRKLLNQSIKSGLPLHQIFEEAHHNKYSQNEPINKRLFLGAGYHSKIWLNNLHKRLEFAASQLGGMQQNGGMGTVFDEAYQKQAEENLKDVIRDFMMAFGIWEPE